MHGFDQGPTMGYQVCFSRLVCPSIGFGLCLPVCLTRRPVTRQKGPVGPIRSPVSGQGCRVRKRMIQWEIVVVHTRRRSLSDCRTGAA